MLASSNARPTIRRECGEAGERTHANHVLPSKLRLIPHSFRRKIDVPSHANGNQRVSSRETSLFPMLKRTNTCSVGTGATNGFRTVALQFISPRIMHFQLRCQQWHQDQHWLSRMDAQDTTTEQSSKCWTLRWEASCRSGHGRPEPHPAAPVIAPVPHPIE